MRDLSPTWNLDIKSQYRLQNQKMFCEVCDTDSLVLEVSELTIHCEC